jgi:hypothetical protein
MVYDPQTEQCMVAQPPTCPAGQTWNPQMNMCAAAAPPTCPAGQTWNAQTNSCVAAGPPIPAGSTCAPAQALDPAAAAMVTQGLSVLGQQNAPPGAKASGTALAGNFQAGQCLEQQIMLNAGKCYTVVATGAGPTEIDVQFVAALGPLSQPIAQDNTTGAMAVLGKNPDCFKNPFPVAGPVKLVLKVVAGQGMAAAQVFEK